MWSPDSTAAHNPSMGLQVSSLSAEPQEEKGLVQATLLVRVAEARLYSFQNFPRV